MKNQYKFIFIGMSLLFILLGCSSSEPPNSVLDSIVIARHGIDDFGGVKVEEFTNAMQTATEKIGGEVIGWKKEGDLYYFEVQNSKNGAPKSVTFKPLNDGYTLLYLEENPSPMAAIQLVRIIFIKANSE